MTRGCSLPTCGRSPAKKSSCCGLRLCAEHAATSAAHSCPAQARLLAMTPADVKRWQAENAPEQTLTTQVIAALNTIGGLRVWRVDAGGARQRNAVLQPEPGSPDVQGFASPDGRFVGVETKCNHPDQCKCDSCGAQRAFGARIVGAGGVYVGNVRRLQDAIDGVKMGLARARGPRAHDRVRCLRCGHVWASRLASGQIPKQCGLCLSPSAGENGETMIVAVARDAERSAG